jgi:hypothetical protein
MSLYVGYHRAMCTQLLATRTDSPRARARVCVCARFRWGTGCMGVLTMRVELYVYQRRSALLFSL